jgi:hypothetical protein
MMDRGSLGASFLYLTRRAAALRLPAFPLISG